MNYILSGKAQVSTEHMEQMTKAMHAISQSTLADTVSMRIITLVTLIYLPGTFVSVCEKLLSVLHVLIAHDLTDSYEHSYCNISARELFGTTSLHQCGRTESFSGTQRSALAFHRGTMESIQVARRP